MTLNIEVLELLFLLEDNRRYGKDCEHIGYDPCCCFCQADKVLQAWNEGELSIEGESAPNKKLTA